MGKNYGVAAQCFNQCTMNDAIGQGTARVDRKSWKYGHNNVTRNKKEKTGVATQCYSFQCEEWRHSWGYSLARWYRHTHQVSSNITAVHMDPKRGTNPELGGRTPSVRDD